MSYKEALLKNMLNTDPKKISITRDIDTSDTDDEYQIGKKTKVNQYKINKKEAIKLAQDELIKSCLPSKNVCKKILKEMYNNNWKGYKINIDINDNKLCVNHNGYKFIFDKNRFFQNPNLKYFRYYLINEYIKLLNENIWVSIKKHKTDDMKYIIILSKRRFS